MHDANCTCVCGANPGCVLNASRMCVLSVRRCVYVLNVLSATHANGERAYHNRGVNTHMVGQHNHTTVSALRGMHTTVTHFGPKLVPSRLSA